MPLVFNIAQIRLAYPIAISNVIGTWQPFIEDTQELFIRPILGDALFEHLSIFSNDIADEPTAGIAPPVKTILILTLRNAVSLYALHLGIDQIALSISGAGVQVLQSDTHKPAAVFSIMNQKDVFLSRAHRQIDLALGFIKKNPATITGYALPANPYFIRSADEFQKYSDIHGSRRVFLSLLPIIGNIEMKFIRPTLSPVQFDALKTAFRSETTLSADNQALLEIILPALVHLTMSRALLEIPIDTLDWGIFNNSNSTFNSIQTKSQANRERISAMQAANERDGEAELKMLQEFLDNNASANKYPLYFASSRYAGPENSVKRGEFLNDATNSIFVV